MSKEDQAAIVPVLARLLASLIPGMPLTNLDQKDEDMAALAAYLKSTEIRPSGSASEICSKCGRAWYEHRIALGELDKRNRICPNEA